MNLFRLLIYFLLIIFTPTPITLVWGSVALPAGCSEEIRVYTDSAETIQVEVGEEFAVALESNQTTGYRWQFSKSIDPAILEFKGSEYKTPDVERVGAGGQEIWTFKAVGQGIAMIVLKYVRPWERDMYPLESRTFIVEVR